MYKRQALNFNEWFLIIQDFGDTTFQIAGTSSDYEALYRHADNLLLQFQQLSIVDVQLPVFNKKMILDEVYLFEEWFLRFRIEGQKLEINPENKYPVGWEKQPITKFNGIFFLRAILIFRGRHDDPILVMQYIHSFNDELKIWLILKRNPSPSVC